MLGLLSQVEHTDGPERIRRDQTEASRAAFWGYQLLDACEDETLAGVIGSNAFWQALLYAFLAGRRHTILELYRDPQLFDDLIKAQAFQSGRSPDELTRQLEASWLELRTELGRHPKPREVAEAAGGVWSEIDDCWQFDHLDGLPSVPSGALYDRLDKIRRKHS